MTASTRYQNSTLHGIPITDSSTSNVSTTVWLHLILMLISSLLLYPTLLILTRRNHPWLTALNITTLITILLGTAIPFFQRQHLNQTSHSALGYILVLSSSAYLGYDLWNSRSRSSAFSISKSEHGDRFFTHPSSTIIRFLHLTAPLIFPLLLYIAIILGVLALLGLCSGSYTQQCFGHLGIGSVYILYFSFWAILVVCPPTLFRNLKSEVLDAVLLVPAGLGLTFFGHAWEYPWDDESIQHVLLGIFSLIGTTLGVYLSLSSPSHPNRPRRNILSGLVALAAGYTFLSHPSKHLALLSSLHNLMGLLNAGIGICRILDVVFVSYVSPPPTTPSPVLDSSSPLTPSPSPSPSPRSPFHPSPILPPRHEIETGLRGPWNALASFLGISAGVVTMLANEEQAALLEKWDVGAANVTMGAAVLAVGVMGYVSVLAILLLGQEREYGQGYARVEMDEVVDQDGGLGV